MFHNVGIATRSKCGGTINDDILYKFTVEYEDGRIVIIV